MTGILFMGVVTALAVFAILAKTYAAKPKRAEKWEKGEIIKQLLELSDRENSASAIASPPARNLQPASTSTKRSDMRKCTRQEPESKRRSFSMNPNPPISLRPNQTDAEIEEQIRQRAYELYQGRGEADGNATDDWLQAKDEVLSFKAKAGTTSS